MIDQIAALGRAFVVEMGKRGVVAEVGPAVWIRIRLELATTHKEMARLLQPDQEILHCQEVRIVYARELFANDIRWVVQT